MARAKRYQPHNPALAEYQRQQKEAAEAARRDRKSTDLLRNAMVAPIEVKDDAGDRIVVMRSIRNDPLAALHSRRQIDEAQYQGGRAFQFDFERIEHGPQAVDPSKPYVDCSHNPQPLSNGYSESLARLNGAHKVLGQFGVAITRDVLIENMTLDRVAAKREMNTELERKYLGRRFRECLDSLALVYGFAMKAGCNNT